MMHIVPLTRNQLAYLADSSKSVDYEVTIKVVPSVDICKWLNANLDADCYKIEDKNVDVINIYNIKSVVDALITLSISFVHLEDAIKFKLEN